MNTPAPLKTISGSLTAQDKKFALVVARFNDLITSHLLSGAQDCLLRHGVRGEDLTVVYVPGSFELPLVCQRLAQSGQFHGVIALGAVIRGATSHYDYVCNETAKGIAQASLQSGVPVLFGVLTTETLEQALERAGSKAGNKGYEAALSAIEMASLLEQLPRG